ncbi:hypothetical protein FGO68_gene9800 [Halteria grandinella]|uniref:Uncharacterized protein n=1 Tax=Halteria grandinella TaxID=5974 RepID=A0A8J8T6U9_HALGN|nr:hypothetical protein FGO68_gene9800 [Halteria grandinella]
MLLERLKSFGLRLFLLPLLSFGYLLFYYQHTGHSLSSLWKKQSEGGQRWKASKSGMEKYFERRYSNQSLDMMKIDFDPLLNKAGIELGRGKIIESLRESEYNRIN